MIVWLASYPKSGNTWMRALLTAYRRQQPPDIDDLDRIGIASSSPLLTDLAGYDVDLLTRSELQALRPDLYVLHAADPRAVPEMKVHDAQAQVSNGRWLFPPEATAASVVIVRHPFDVCISANHHFGHHDLDETVDLLCRPHARLGGGARAGNLQVRHHLGSWSAHVTSWIDGPTSRPIVVVRYEDLVTDTANELSRVVEVVDLPLDGDRLDAAVASTSFQRLQEQERAGGFREQAALNRTFFRRGTTGEGFVRLTPAQRRRLVEEHGEVMARLGYGESSVDPLPSPLRDHPTSSADT